MLKGNNIGFRLIDYFKIWNSSLLNPNEVWKKLSLLSKNSIKTFYTKPIVLPRISSYVLADLSDIMFNRTIFLTRLRARIIVWSFNLLFMLFLTISFISLLIMKDIISFVGSIGVALSVLPIIYYIYKK